MLVKHISREQIAVSTAVKTLTALSEASRAAFRYADIQVLSNDIRVTYDGSTSPVGTSTGTLWYATKTYRVWGYHNFAKLKMIRESADAVAVVDNWGGA